MKKKFWMEVVGWYGVFAVILAYVLLSFDKISANDILYQGLNITGALGVTYIAYKKNDYESSILNAVWALIGIISIISILHLI